MDVQRTQRFLFAVYLSTLTYRYRLDAIDLSLDEGLRISDCLL